MSSLSVPYTPGGGISVPIISTSGVFNEGLSPEFKVFSHLLVLSGLTLPGLPFLMEISMKLMTQIFPPDCHLLLHHPGTPPMWLCLRSLGPVRRNFIFLGLSSVSPCSHARLIISIQDSYHLFVSGIWEKTFRFSPLIHLWNFCSCSLSN